MQYSSVIRIACILQYFLLKDHQIKETNDFSLHPAVAGNGTGAVLAL
jgi:hypothetical protein